MTLILCPGVHAPAFTTEFYHHLAPHIPLPLTQPPPLIVPTDRYPAYSPGHLLTFLRAAQPDPPWVFLGFSAGCVAIAGVLPILSVWGIPITAIFALDAWGVWFPTTQPVHHLCHDRLTHWSAHLWREPKDSFYADPPVEHLNLWRSPHQVMGWQMSVHPQQCRYTTALKFLANHLATYAPS
ncbi:hypothetical protein [Trichothermofontia sp.]